MAKASASEADAGNIETSVNRAKLACLGNGLRIFHEFARRLPLCVAPIKPTSPAVVTSMFRHRRPAATWADELPARIEVVGEGGVDFKRHRAHGHGDSRCKLCAADAGCPVDPGPR